MRKYKFRGKSKSDNEWYIGNLHVKDDGRTYICDHCNGNIDVDPETVGQFTERIDYFGNEIYEGDIVDVSCLNYTGLAEIRFNGGCFCMVAEDWFETLYGFDTDALEIEGNIHDNPELLKSYKENDS